MNLPNAITVGRILVAPLHRGAAVHQLTVRARRGVSRFHHRGRHRLLRRHARAHAQSRHRSRPAARSARRQAAAVRDTGPDVRSDVATDGLARTGNRLALRCARISVRYAVRSGRTSVVDRRDRARARVVHDRLSPARGAARSGDRRDRSREMEDRIPVDVGGLRVLLVLRCDARAQRTAGTPTCGTVSPTSTRSSASSRWEPRSSSRSIRSSCTSSATAASSPADR